MPTVLVALALSLATAAPAAGVQQEDAPSVVGLALSGGSAKGAAHVGVIRMLERMGVRIDAVAGTSAGSVVGAMYGMGLSVDSIQQAITSADWPALIADAVPRNYRFVEQRRLDERPFLTLPLQATRVTLPTGAIVGSNLDRLLEHVTWSAAAVRRFTELPRPFVAVATDLETGEAVPLREGVLSEALRASTGVPGALEPVTIGGRLLIDGALSRNLPAVDARELGSDFVICSDVSDPLDSADELRSLVDVLMQVADFSMHESTLEQRELCDLLIQPETDSLSSFDFGRAEEWVARGERAAEEHEDELRVLAARQSPARPRRPYPEFLRDSVRIASIRVEGADDPRVTDLVAVELDLESGDWVDRDLIASRLGGLDATGLFGHVRYRLDPAGDEVALTVTVEERPRNRVGVGLRYDDERRAALLFTATVYNALRYGSVTRLDLRVGEETQIGARFRRRQGVTGVLGFGVAARWSQAPLELSPALGGRVGVELSTASLYLGLGAGRGTSFGLEAIAERAVSAADAASVRLLSGSLVVDHETLDRIDFPRSGGDVLARFEWGGTDVTSGERFSVTTFDGRTFIPLPARLNLELGAFLGHARGADLPAHRRFYLGGAHRSTVFRRTHPLFAGLGAQKLSGLSVQVARAGLRWEVRPGSYLRVGVDVGGVRDAWRFPMERPMTGWSLSAGVGTLIGPIVLDLGQFGGDRDPQLSISVGREL